jgi:hypothetical protein
LIRVRKEEEERQRDGAKLSKGELLDLLNIFRFLDLGEEGRAFDIP